MENKFFLNLIVCICFGFVVRIFLHIFIFVCLKNIRLFNNTISIEQWNLNFSIIIYNNFYMSKCCFDIVPNYGLKDS
jgi:hypothetical protein